MKKCLEILAVGLLAGLLAAPAAWAYEVTYDFTAHGNIGTFTGNGADTTVGPEETISGTVTFNVLTVSPPAGAETDGITYAVGRNSTWVTAEFEGISSAGSIAAMPWGFGNESFEQWVEVTNSIPPLDYRYTSQNIDTTYWAFTDDGTTHQSYTAFHRLMYNADPWFSGLNWVETLSPQYNDFYFGKYSFDNTPEQNHHGYFGVFHVDTFVISSPATMLQRLHDDSVGKGLGKILENTVKLAQTYYSYGDRKQQATCATLKFYDFEVKVFNRASHTRRPPSWSIADAVADSLLEQSTTIQMAIGCFGPT